MISGEIPKAIHEWLIRTYQPHGYSFYFISWEESGRAIVHDYCSYIFRDVGNVRQALTVGYDKHELLYVPWARNKDGELFENVRIYYADPNLFDRLLEALSDESMQSRCHICRAKASQDEQGTPTPWNQIAEPR